MSTFFKRISVLLIASMLLITSSCENFEQDNESSLNYRVYKNFNNYSSRQSKNIDIGEEVVGVLLKYTSEGSYSSNVFPLDSNTFCIYCLYEEHGFNGDGMEFNYVLYVPERIRQKYIELGGQYPNTGDPFWDYMREYLSMSITEITENWPSAIELLCGLTECPNIDNTYEEIFSIVQTIGNSCHINDLNLFINIENVNQLVVTFDYEILNDRSVSIFNSPDGDIFNIIGNELNSGSGKIAFIIPLENIGIDQKITSSLKFSDVDVTYVGIRILGEPSTLHKEVIPSTAIVIQ